MRITKTVLAAIASSTMFAAGTAAAALVTLNPQAPNGGQGPLSAVGTTFQTTGGTLTLGSAAFPAVLTINGTSGNTTFSEQGRIQIQSFTNPALISGFNSAGTVPNTGLNVDYGIFVDFTFTGGGSYITPNQFQANPLVAPLSFTGNVFAQSNVSGLVNLGTLSLLPTSTSFGIATTQFPPVAGGSGTANTTFSATLGFTPFPGTTGPGGFFTSPVPFPMFLSLGSVGGNAGNTVYSVSPAGIVTITTPANGQSPSTGNFTFVAQVPEPGALSLAGLALLAAGLTTRRKAKAAAAA